MSGGTPLLYGTGTTAASLDYTFSDLRIDHLSSDPGENPWNILAATLDTTTVNPATGAYPDTNTTGVYAYIFRRTAPADGTITIGSPGTNFDDYAELFVNGVLVDSIDRYTFDLPAADVISETVSSGDLIEIRLTNREGLGAFVATLTFTTPTLLATDDTFAAMDGTTGGMTTRVLDNDQLNGAAIADPADIVLTPVSAPSPTAGALTLNADGTITVAPGTTPGTYSYTYQICAASDPTICDTATATVEVGLSVASTPVAVDDVAAALPSTPIVFDTLDNDTGTLDPTSVLLTLTGMPVGAALTPDGRTLTVPGEGVWTVDADNGDVTFTPEATFAGTPTAARYTVADTSGTRSNEAALIAVLAAPDPIDAINDGYSVNGTTGQTTASVLANDQIAGVVITNPADVILTPVTVPTPPAGSLTLNADGTITIGAGTTVGTYNITYQICLAADPSTCDTAQATVVAFSTSTDLFSEIEGDLERILEDDLAHTVTQQSNQISGYSADALDQLQRRTQAQCHADVTAQLAAENILFETDEAIIDPASGQVLDQIAAILSTCSGSAFEIAGHTDSDASDAYNLDLSQRRAAAVLRALTARGIDTTGYAARGYGESQPITSNATEAGKAQNRRVEFRPLDPGVADSSCENGFGSLLRSFNMQADDDGVLADGQFASDTYNCATDQREVFEGTLSYIDTDSGQTQTALNLSYRREQYHGADSVFGVFAGLYGAQSDVDGLADGTITGFGVNGGLYGVNHLQDALFVDYYLGAAVGHHSFDLDFARAPGTINADGSYGYIAGFAGAALSGEWTMGQTIVTPRLGFDYVVTPGSDVDVIAAIGSLLETGSLELDAISGGRLFAEFRTQHPLQNSLAMFFVNPRVSCYQSLGNLDGVCGVGGAIGIETVEHANGLTYSVELSGEAGEGFGTGGLSASFQRQMTLGTLNGGAEFSTQGDLRLVGGYAMQF